MATGAFDTSTEALVRAAAAASAALEVQKQEHETRVARAAALQSALAAWAVTNGGVEVPVTRRFCAKGHEQEAAAALGAFVVANVPSDAWADGSRTLDFRLWQERICSSSDDATQASNVVLDAITSIRGEQVAALRQRVQSIADDTNVSEEVRARARELLQGLQ